MQSRSWKYVIAACLLGLATTKTATAQDMTIYTTVSEQQESGVPRTLCSSLTLFHAGKVYDFMEDAGELVIFEPQQDRFTILNSNYTATRVEFSELMQFLKVAKTESSEYVLELSQRTDPAAGRIRSLLQFQLTPQFQEEAGAKDQLVLRGGVMNYDVRTASPPSPDQVEQYLTYADWAARLNFVLHPGSSYPEPRLKLNEALRTKQALPVNVELNTVAEKPVRLSARHTFHWELQGTDKSHIHKWTQLLESKDVRWVSFHDYQTRLLSEVAHGGR